jgi:glycosyltransferase involved in cell wall biosynthesis
VLPSYSEGTPRAVLEAMSCGRAIITTDAPGCKETVKDGVNGFIVPVRSSEAVAEKMIELIENPLLARKMGEASFEYCKEKFEVSKVNAKMLEIMEITPDKNCN